MNRLAGKTCFVTGAAQGIGQSIVEHFLFEGAQVIAADLRFPDMRDTPGLTRLILDATNEQSVAAAAAAHAEVSVLINCVGYVANGTVLDCTLADFDRSMITNVRSMALTIRAFLPAMLTRSSGNIINVASVVSSVMAAPNRFAYGTSKAAVIGLTISVALDYIARGIRCNCISPGTIDTPSLHERIASSGNTEKARAAFVARQPIGRLGKTEEIAATAVFLASDESAFMSGANIVIDGGMSL